MYPNAKYAILTKFGDSAIPVPKFLKQLASILCASSIMLPNYSWSTSEPPSDRIIRTGVPAFMTNHLCRVYRVYRPLEELSPYIQSRFIMDLSVKECGCNFDGRMDKPLREKTTTTLFG